MSQYLERVDTKNDILQASLIVSKCNYGYVCVFANILMYKQRNELRYNGFIMREVCKTLISMR